MRRLDERLSAIIEEINGETAADIGTDHGKVAVHAILSGKVKKVIATDISGKSLKKARLLAAFHGLGDAVIFGCFDGIKDLPFTPDCIVIAGMGARETVKILEEGGNKADTKLILMPHSDTWILRKYLFEKRRTVEKDYVVFCAGKFYELIVSSSVKAYGEGAFYKQEEIYTGKNIPYSESFYKRLESRKVVIDTVILKITAEGAEMSAALLKEKEEIEKCLLSR